MAQSSKVTSAQVIHVAAEAGLTRDEAEKLEHVLLDLGKLDTGRRGVADKVDEAVPAPVARLVERYIIDGAISARQVERLALLSGLAGGAGALRGALHDRGVDVRPDEAPPDDGFSAEEDDLDEGDDHNQGANESDLVEGPAHEDTPTGTMAGQGVYDPNDHGKALAVAQDVLHEDGHRSWQERTLTALEEWGLCALLREGLPLDQDVPVDYVRALLPDSQAHRAWTALVTHNLRLVKKIAAGYGDRVAEGLAQGDIDHHGVLGLMTAIRKFDVTRRNKLSTYATFWIRQSIERGIANEGSLIRYPVHFQDTIRKVRHAEQRLREQGRRPSHENLRLQTGLSARAIENYFRLRRHIDYLDRLVGDTTLGELIQDDRTSVSSPDEILDESLRRERVEGILSLLPARTAAVLRLRYGLDDDQERTLDQIGSVFGVTRERIRQIESKALTTIRDWLDDTPLLPDHTPEDILDQIIRRAQVEEGVTRSLVSPPRGARNAAILRLRGRARLLQALGTSGHTLTAAMAELVDRAIRAGAGTVRIDYSPTAGRTWVAITDDGYGMDNRELRRVMRVAPGTGLTAISLSQTRVVSVLSRETSGLLAAQTWDVGRVTENGRWYARRQADPEALQILEHLRFVGPGTVVLWRRTLGSDVGDRFARRVESAARALGLIFHRAMEENKVRLFVAGSPIIPVDPFMFHHPATQNRGVEEFVYDGHRVRINPVVLPHPSRLPDGAGPPGRAGFYLYRGGRLIVTGGWLGIADMSESDDTSLARVSVELSAEAALLWGLDPSRLPGALPEPVIRRLTLLAEDARARSARVFARRHDDSSLR